MLMYNTKYGGLYDKDVKTKVISKILRSFHDDNITFHRSSYSYSYSYVGNSNFKNATTKEIKKFQCTYYREDGSRPFKTRNCKTCKKGEECNHNQEYYY